MKRLALLLGSLLVVSAAASAKEVVPAPVVVEEAPVQIVEKEVIVYRDKEEGFRPNGYVDAYYRYYGETEGQDLDGAPYWNASGNKYSKMEMNGAINMTENQTLQYRVRSYNELDHNHDIAGTPADKLTQNGNTGNQVRLRYLYNHGLLGDSKVNLTSRVHYNDDGSSQELEYQAQFNFAEYLFNNDFVKTTDFTLAPLYRYTWADENSSKYDNALGVDFTSSYDLPWGFSAAFNLYAKQHFYGEGNEFTVDNERHDKDFTVDMEAYLYYTANLYTADKYTVDFKFEGGYDDYSWSKEKQYKGETSNQHAEYEAYMLPHILMTYNVTDDFSVYGALGAEYRNWGVHAEKSATNWRWQPTAWAGFNVAF